MFLTKYSANGNDFLITTALNGANRARLAQKLCDRHNGVGADGFVVLLPHDRFAYHWEFYNADGSKANMCGNASRCVAHYAYSHKIAPKNHSFLSGAGEIKVRVSKNIVEVNLGKVRILQTNIAESTQNPNDSADALLQNKITLNFMLLDSGVPHLVTFTSSEIKNALAKNLVFLQNLRKKYNANVNLAFICDKANIEIATFERGVENITLACGTGMCAVYYAALAQKLFKGNATLIPPSGDKIALRLENSSEDLENNEICFKGVVKKIADIVV